MGKTASVALRVLLAFVAAVGALLAAFFWGLFYAYGYNAWLGLAAAIFSVPPLGALWLYYAAKRAGQPEPRPGREGPGAPAPPAAVPEAISPEGLLAAIISEAGAGEKARADLQAFLDECRATGMDDRDTREALLAFARGYFGSDVPSPPPLWVDLAKLLFVCVLLFAVVAVPTIYVLWRWGLLRGLHRPPWTYVVSAAALLVTGWLVVRFVGWLRSASAERPRLGGLTRFFGNSAIVALVTMFVLLVLLFLQAKGVIRFPGRPPWTAAFMAMVGVCWTYLSLLFLLLPRRVLQEDPFLSGILRHLGVKSFIGLRTAAAVFLLVPATVCYLLLTSP